MPAMEILPPLRQDIDLVPVRHEGKPFLLVRDPLGIAGEGLAISGEIARYFPFFDGATSVSDFQLALSRQGGGAIVPTGEIFTLVEQLDGIGLLQTDRYRRERERIVGEFTGRTERAAALSGSAYPAEREELAAQIDGMLSGAPEPDGSAPAPCAVAAPHIDLTVSGGTYGRAYAPLRSGTPAAILVLGTGHALESPYCLTEKTFTTPLGRIPTEVEGVKRLRDSGGDIVAGDDFVHRSEHSIEFQLLFLQRLFPMEEIPILPLLCGSLEPWYLRGMSPLDDPPMKGFVGELGRWLEEDPSGRIAVAGVDLSHVGPKFGDKDPAAALEEEFRASDRKLLDALEEGDAGALYEQVASTENRFKVCGFSALWTLLAALPGLRGEVLDYRVWHEEPTRSAVSFGAVAFHRPGG